MSEEFIPTLTHATERDIDLLLVEELFSSPDFVRWMLQHSGLPGDFDRSHVLHSKRRTQSRREIDIFLETFGASGKQTALLIENKLDASEQPDQAESYREELGIMADRFSDRAMVIVCPSHYAAQHIAFSSKFDATVTYEMLEDYFRNAGTSSQSELARLRFRADLLSQAINKSRRGYTPIPNEVIGGFNAKYVALLANITSDIIAGPTMLKTANPNESVSMIFDHRKSLAFLPKDIRPSRFSHELGRGDSKRANYVSVVFPNWGFAIDFLRKELERDAADIGAKFLSKPPTKTRPNPGLVMYCETKPVDNQGDFVEQAPIISHGIETALKLRSWLQSNQDILKQWYSRIEEVKGTA